MPEKKKDRSRWTALLHFLSVLLLNFIIVSLNVIERKIFFAVASLAGSNLLAEIGNALFRTVGCFSACLLFGAATGRITVAVLFGSGSFQLVFPVFKIRLVNPLFHQHTGHFHQAVHTLLVEL